MSAKADVLTFLLGLGERQATIQAIERATGYAGVTVRDATRDMTLARLIQETDGHPVSYYARGRSWALLLEPGGLRTSGEGEEPDLPSWRFWSTVFAFLAHVDRLACSAATDSDYVQSSLARDLNENHRSVFTDNRIDVPDPDDYRGAAYLTGFRETVQSVSEWMMHNL